MSSARPERSAWCGLKLSISGKREFAASGFWEEEYIAVKRGVFGA